MKAGRFVEAIAVYKQLDFPQGAQGRSEALLAFGHAQAGVKNQSDAKQAFSAALEAKPDGQVSFPTC